MWDMKKDRAFLIYAETQKRWGFNYSYMTSSAKIPTNRSSYRSAVLALFPTNCWNFLPMPRVGWCPVN